jgi:hypothetical protein
MAVERFERSLKFNWNAERIEVLGLAASLFGHPRADMLPQVTEFRHIPAGYIVGHRDAGQFDDAGLDRVHQGEVTHRPREESPFDIAGAA